MRGASPPTTVGDRLRPGLAGTVCLAILGWSSQADAQGCSYPVPTGCGAESLCKREPTGCAARCIPDGVGSPQVYWGMRDDAATPPVVDHHGVSQAELDLFPNFTGGTPTTCAAVTFLTGTNGIAIDPGECIVTQESVAAADVLPSTPRTALSITAWITRRLAQNQFGVVTAWESPDLADTCLSGADAPNLRLMTLFGTLEFRARLSRVGAGIECLAARANGGDVTEGAGPIPADGQPHFVAATVDLVANGTLFYVDGVEIGTQNQQTDTRLPVTDPDSNLVLDPFPYPLAIGAGLGELFGAGDPVNPFEGDIYEVAIYGRELTLMEVGDFFSLGEEVSVVDADGNCMFVPEPDAQLLQFVALLCVLLLRAAGLRPGPRPAG